MQAKPERGSLPESEPGRRRAPHYSRTRVASRTPAAFYRFETRPAVPSDPAKRPSIRPLPTLDLRLWTAPPPSWPALPGCGAKRPCRSSGLRRGCRSARPKGPSPCSLIWLRAKTNAKPQAPLTGVNGVLQKHDILTNRESLRQRLSTEQSRQIHHAVLDSQDFDRVAVPGIKQQVA